MENTTKYYDQGEPSLGKQLRNMPARIAATATGRKPEKPRDS